MRQRVDADILGGIPGQVNAAASAACSRCDTVLRILRSAAMRGGNVLPSLDDPAFPGITYRSGASGQPTPVIRGTGIRVQTMVIAERAWRLSIPQIAEEWNLSERQVTEALAFYAAHRAEIDADIEAEEQMVP